MIPSAAEARDFLDDPSPYKRQALIDRLLASPSFARRMQQVFDVMLMERRAEVYVKAGPWREFLYQAFAENRPYDVLARQILAADGADPASRPAARFLLDREADPNLIARDVGRLFLGMDLQCCQCHDHPLIDGYKQQHYYGLYAFVSRTVLIGGKSADGTLKPGSVAVIGEKAEGDVKLQLGVQEEDHPQNRPACDRGPARGLSPPRSRVWNTSFLPTRKGRSGPCRPSAAALSLGRAWRRPSLPHSRTTSSTASGP